LRLTEAWLRRFGCQAQLHGGGMDLSAARPAGGAHRVHGDWGAAAALFCAAAVLDGEIRAHPLSPDDCQPDMAILRILEKAGCSWRFKGECCHFVGGLRSGIYADLAPCPDLAPVLAAAAAFAPGESLLCGLGALPHKESDRLGGCARLAGWLGARHEILEGPSLRIHGGGQGLGGAIGAMPPTGAFDTLGDHRMAFAAAIGALRLGGAVLGPGCVNKSFPGFWDAIGASR
jgi:3-phosphoshikimate 1-carboxyvinyltransferase